MLTNAQGMGGNYPISVFDIATTVAGRSFLTKILDALGVQMDITAMAMNESFREAMTVGRPICEDEVELLDK